MYRKIVTLMICSVILAGCLPKATATGVVDVSGENQMVGAETSEPSSPTPTPMPIYPVTESASTPTAIPSTGVESGDGECDHPFYPVKDGAVWQYNIGADALSTNTMAVDDAGAFTITIRSDESTFTIDGQCTEEGIVIMSVPGATTTYSGQEGGSTVTTTDVEGISIPKDIKINDTWSQTIHVTTGDTASIIQSDFTAIGFENITVPAGDFYALKVEESGYVEIWGQTVNMHGYHWFAEGVGEVKSAIDGAPVLELASYDIPD